MFKFDFHVELEGGESTESPFSTTSTQATGCDSGPNDVGKITVDDNIEWHAAERVRLREEMLGNMKLFHLNAMEMTLGAITLEYMLSACLPQQDDADAADAKQTIRKADKSHSDLLPGIYEGGAKIWECTDDLLRFLVCDEQRPKEWHDKRVLDLGCGCGLLGLFAYKSGAIVEFQDYNTDVLENLTIPNFLLNATMPDNANDFNLKKLNNEASFYSGDWAQYAVLTAEDEKFEIILTSETIYNPKNQQKLLDSFDSKLKSTGGSIYVAAKTYYFGVGGGLRQFEDLIIKDKRFESTVVWSAKEGIGREILLLKRL